MTILQLNELATVKMAIQVINNKREIIWENDKFQDVFGSDERRGAKCWEIMHPNNPECGKCEARGSYIQEILKNGCRKQFIINNSPVGNKGFIKFVEAVDQIVNAYEEINGEIEAIKAKLSTLIDRLDTIVICTSCERMRLKDGTWIDKPIHGAKKLFARDLSHGYCPECAQKVISQI